MESRLHQHKGSLKQGSYRGYTRWVHILELPDALGISFKSNPCLLRFTCQWEPCLEFVVYCSLWATGPQPKPHKALPSTRHRNRWTKTDGLRSLGNQRSSPHRATPTRHHKVVHKPCRQGGRSQPQKNLVGAKHASLTGRAGLGLGVVQHHSLLFLAFSVFGGKAPVLYCLGTADWLPQRLMLPGSSTFADVGCPGLHNLVWDIG